MSEFAGVEIAVAITAGTETGCPVGHMTPIARHLYVLALKRVARTVVIEVGLVRYAPGLRVVAAFAIAAKLAFMRIDMAVRAAIMLNARELKILAILCRWFVSEHRMTSATCNLAMGAGQREAGLRMIEAGRRSPRGWCVALRALTCKLAPVFVGMAAWAILIQSVEGPVQVDLSRPQTRRLSHVFRPMAGTAIKRRMFTLEPIASERVLETSFAALPINEREVASLMLHMTELAFGVTLAPMQSEPRIDLFLDNHVAGETLIRDELAFGAMALVAALYSFQKRVRAVQIAGRQLPSGGGRG